MPLRFYHVGGFYSHIRRHAYIPMSSQEIADKFMGPKVEIKAKEEGEFQFVLGITPCGASYLLLSQYTVDNDPYLRSLFNGRAWSSDRFVSLSPVDFADAGALSAKLASLANNKAKKKGQEPRDRSQANVAYTTGVSNPDILQQAGIDRANFEYHRLLFQLCKGTISPSEYDALGVPWFYDIDAMWSFAYNIWASDRRTLAERQQDPKVLDVSWTEYDIPSSSDNLRPRKTNHFVVKENRGLGNPTRADFLHGETEQASRGEITPALQNIFNEAKRTRPVLLFVHDTKWAMLVLKLFGVDTSEWRLGVEPVLGRQLLEMTHSRDIDGLSASGSYGRGRDYKADRYSYGRGEKSERSRSPARERPPYARSRSPPQQQKSPYPVYVVDVQNLYVTMRRMVTGQGATSVAEIAHALRVNFERPELAEQQPTTAAASAVGWCAGNESRVLGYLWSAMVSGNAIDEQRLSRFDRIIQQTHLPQMPDEKKAAVTAAAPPVPAAALPEDSDSDRDPNDIPVAGPSSNANAQGTSGNDPYASDEDDYLDF